MPDLTPSWREAFARLVADHPIVTPPERDARGRWALAIEASMSSASAIVAGLPGVWELDRYEEEELIDASGEGIDLEWTSELWVAPGERAILSCVDHWQAGLFGTLTLLPDDAAFLALRALLANADREVDMTG